MHLAIVKEHIVHDPSSGFDVLVNFDQLAMARSLPGRVSELTFSNGEKMKLAGTFEEICATYSLQLTQAKRA